MVAHGACCGHGVHDAHPQDVVLDRERDVYASAAVLYGVTRCLLNNAVGLVSHPLGQQLPGKGAVDMELHVVPGVVADGRHIRAHGGVEGHVLEAWRHELM